MGHEQDFSPERLLGFPAPEVVKYIFTTNSRISKGYLNQYYYEPGLPDLYKTFGCLIPFDPTGNLNFLLNEHFLPGYDIGIFSKVEMIDGSFGHLPLIDFELPVNPLNLAKVKQRLSKFSIGEKASWVILDSGFGYQAYCLNKILPIERNDEHTILKFAQECHRILDFVDDREHDEITHGWWFIHSSVRGGMTLRLTRNRPELKKKIPEVVGHIISA